MERKQRNNTFTKNVANYLNFNKHKDEKDINYGKDDITMNKEVYQIELCLDGRFAATFDTANLRIKILQNTDYRPFIFNKKKNFRNENELEESVEIDKTIAYFKIKDDFSIDKLYDQDPPPFDGNNVGFSDNDENETKKSNFRWSFDISNMHKNNDKYFIFVAVSRINIEEDMKGKKKDEDIKGNDKQKKQKKDDNGKSDYEREPFRKRIFNCPNEHENILSNDETRINISSTDENITATSNTTDESKKGVEKGVAIYHDSSKDDSSKDDSHNSELKRFTILNFRGIYNIEFNDDYDFLKLNEKFEYPQNIRFVLDHWLTFAEFADCTNRLLSCIYDKYFLVTRYKNSEQSLEVYDLAKMEHEIGARLVKNIVDEYIEYIFSVSRLQLCFTQVNTVNDKKLLIIGQGLKKGEDQKDELKVEDLEEGEDQESNKDKEDKKVLKFIIWDLYNTGEHELVELHNFPITKTNMDDIYTRLAITSGNILQIDDDGKVSSVLKKVENEINKKKLDKAAGPNIVLKNIFGKLNGKDDKNHTLYYDKNINFKQICNDREPWLPGGSKRTSYCLYYNEKGTETETLQLIVGRSTVQIWHQVNDSKNKDVLPNKGEAFLEYIWSNRIPVKQEREITSLRIEKFEYGPNYGSKSKEYDFYLKVYWFERNDSSKQEERKKMTEQEIIKEEDDEINRIEKELKQINSKDNDLNEAEKEKKRQEIINNCVKVKIREKVIRGKDAIKKSHVARHACKALEHTRKRYKKNFRLLDIRYNLMKSLILADCDRLIKFILFGYEETAKNKIDYRHVPSSKLWPGKKFLKDDDLDFDEREYGLKKQENNDLNERKPENDSMKQAIYYYCKKIYLYFFKREPKEPENNMELAIYYCRGRELKDAIKVAYLLEYYSRNPTNCVGWMCTVSKAIPLLFKYNYDDFARKLFIRCFAEGHLSGQDPDEIIPKGYLENYNSDIKFRALIPLVKLKSDESAKLKWYDHNWIWNKFKDLINKLKGYRNFEKSPLALRIVPFPGFTINSIKKNEKKLNLFEEFLSPLLSILIPKPRQIKQSETNKLSPFSRMILYENNGDVYDNPAIEAVINFLSLAYLDRSFIVNGNLLLVLIIVFYYLAIYLFIIEVKQIRYRGPKKYMLDLLNIVDMISIILPVTVMSMMLDSFQLSDGFGIIEESDSKLVVEISFSIFLIWIQFVNIGIYIYYVVIIFEAIIPFLWFMFFVILAFAHTMFILLRDPNKNITIKNSTYSGNATNLSTNETLNITLKSDFNPKSSDDNPFSTFSTAMEAAYFWISGDWVQRDDFEYWAVDFFTLIASIFLVIILQNILIAFMKYQANYIATFEALHIHFSGPEPEPQPKHIYYFSLAKNFEEWYDTRKREQGAIYKDYEEEESSIFTTSDIFKERDYDKRSFLTYNDNIKIIVKDFINSVNDNTKNLIKRAIDKNSIEEIDDVEDDLKRILEKLEKKYL
ncbi:9582_t:CDS:10 [Rhizophagus irregularis]|nr:9582_t:CDS:10 [Rhizophagus irregularis]